MTPAPKTYVRPMNRWWMRHPAYRRYLLREGTSVMVAAYALFLLAGMVCLVLGETAFNLWRGFLQSPVSVIFHLAALAAFAFHAWTWFKVMPLTTPPLRFRGRPVPDRMIFRAALWAWGIASLVLLVLAMRFL
ncbi:fumarate reductase subunit C [Ectothiorhodospira shaposhnikovii]|uniref:fumarate reductase subunit C n=1 Tax=Ectothiorhodospira shaposhnikovii TaxID=1054 RepID=UPI001905A86D|nr:fumarate reductase subunit C [Ectothiorhodospira shaposhnikovii]MBK1673191.1 fumarate reductase subunit C [Ectothiorhodospira shaposhnikovii]